MGGVGGGVVEWLCWVAGWWCWVAGWWCKVAWWWGGEMVRWGGGWGGGLCFGGVVRWRGGGVAWWRCVSLYYVYFNKYVNTNHGIVQRLE